MKKTQDGKVAIWYVIAALLVFYFVFMILKINGVGDYTSKYGIEFIDDAEGYNSVMMIDGDVETTWGLLTDFEPGSNIYMKFKAPRSISEVHVLNVSDAESVLMGISVSDDGQRFKVCPSVPSMDGQTTIYKLVQPVRGEYVVFTYAKGAGGHWPITELEIYE